MIHRTHASNTRLLPTQLNTLFMTACLVVLTLVASGLPGQATAASCAAGAITISNGSGGCEVDGVNAVTTVAFQTGVLLTDRLLLQGNAPAGNIGNVTSGEGAVGVQGTVTQNATIGVTGGGPIAALGVFDGATFNMIANISANNVIIGQGTSGIYNLAAGTLTATNLAISPGGVLNQIGNGVLTVTNMSIGAGGLYTYDETNNLVVGTDISGAGGVIKDGTGVLTLSGTNSYSGGTLVSGGTLLGNTSSLQGTIVNNSTVGFVQTSLGTYAGNMSGTGSLTKTGGSRLTLTGDNTYTGDTTVTNGQLWIGNGGTSGSISGNLINNWTVTFNRSDDITYGGDISGSGDLSKIGTGTLTLTGNNTYTGVFFHINGGTVSVSADNNLGDPSVILRFNGGALQTTSSFSSSRITFLDSFGGTFITDPATVFTHNGTITGVGALTKSGDGSLILSGANDYTGGTNINAGTVFIDSDNNLGDAAGVLVFDGGTLYANSSMNSARNITLNAGGGTFDDNFFDLGLSGVISGPGGLIKSGPGNLTLTGANTYSGGTIVNNGGLIGTTTSLQGNITNNSAVFFSQTTNGTYTGVISGTGSLSKSGTGTVTLTGANTYSGGTVIYDGTLQLGDGGATGSISGNITNDSILIFNRSDAITYGDVVSGTGSVIQAGSGSTNLTGANTYSGATTINNGILYVNGSSSSSTHTINAGGTLGGTGTVGSVFVNGGIFAPGNSIGTTNVAGNVDFSGGGIYQVEVNAAGQSDLIHATGTATLTSGTVEVLPEAGTYDFSTDYTILTADGGLGGTTFDSVSSNLAFLDPTLSYDANNVYLNLVRNDVSFTNNAVATTPNQVAVAKVLEQLGVTDPTAVQDIMNQLLLLTNEGAQQAFDSLSGVQHSVNPMLSNRLMHRLFALLQVNHGRHGWGKHFAAFNGQTTTGLNSGNSAGNDRHWWITGFAGDGDIDDSMNGTIEDIDYRDTGLAFGVDFPFNTAWNIGFAGSFSRSDIDSRYSDSDVDSYQLAAYANWHQGDWYADTAIGYAKHDTDSERTVIIGSSISNASADYDSDTLGARIEVGKHYQLRNGMTVTPFGGLEYLKTDREDFTETGSLANLVVDDEDHESIRTRLGLNLSRTYKTDQGSSYTPSASIAWVHEHGDDDNRMTAAFSAAPATAFTVEGNDIDRDRLQLNLGITGQVKENIQFNVGYSGEFAGSDDYHSLNATLRMKWH